LEGKPVVELVEEPPPPEEEPPVEPTPPAIGLEEGDAARPLSAGSRCVQFLVSKHII